MTVTKVSNPQIFDTVTHIDYQKHSVWLVNYGRINFRDARRIWGMDI